MEYTKEQLRAQVEVGVEYVVKMYIPRIFSPLFRFVNSEGIVHYLTEHLWGTIGMVLQNAKQVDLSDMCDCDKCLTKRGFGDEHEGEIPVQ